MRRAIQGKPLRPKAGYGGDARTRGIHPSGYAEVNVHNESDLEGLDSKTQAARIASKVGLLKRESILSKADELGIKVLNR
jgi:large subunit ribosomal protein L32e